MSSESSSMCDDVGSSQINGESSGSKDNVCRDFLRNACTRGRLCRYKHPDPEVAEALGKRGPIFCHDYQNKECRRPNCKFVHCTKQDEDYFKMMGHLPEYVLENMANKGSSVGLAKKMPVCKDYLKGDCRRAGRCKFRHISASPSQLESASQASRPRKNRFDDYDEYDNYGGYEPETKRRAFESGMIDHGYIDRRLALPQHHRMLEEENALLLQKIEELKKQVADLTATNEFLLDQNAQLRVSKQTLVSPISQQLIPHTLTSTLTSLPPPSITQLSQIPLSTDLGAASLQQQRLAPDLAAATQTMAPMVPVTLGQGIAPVSIAASPVTIPPAISAASLSQSLAQTIITSTALVSYPIMTQSMRPVIPHSLGH